MIRRRRPKEGGAGAGRTRQKAAPQASGQGVLEALPNLQSELKSVRTAIPEMTGGLVATTGGVVLAHDTDGLEPAGVAELTAAALNISARLAEATGQGTFLELITRGERGYIATYAAGALVVLTLFAGPDANLGLLNFEARRVGTRIAAQTEALLRQSAMDDSKRGQ
ncbi:roadblock/LC7 domain-containing protein [Phaeacidiphilus oryzae]|uniref:roadblock/LC7 domain-containing protein n=1 Tax=Phaeacidiphilus oryzae TaxID=348818 RepID=UPI000A03E5FC|nr:roadblock/LC7 domain-containing protein [Phaeacidiphilus oryzae]